MNSYGVMAKDLISSNFPLVISFLELQSYFCPLVNLRFFVRDWWERLCLGKIRAFLIVLLKLQINERAKPKD